MKPIYNKLKKCVLILMMMLCMAFVTQQTAVPVYAYTQEEKDAAKAWLSANGYSPDAAGAYAAYADYMNGKFGAIPGLPEPNVPQPPAEEPEDTSEDDTEDEEPEEKGSEKDKPPKDDDSETEQTGGEVTAQPPTDSTETETDLQEGAGGEEVPVELPEGLLEELPEELPDLELPTLSQQEFADMIDVFAGEFSEDEQEEINKAKARLEKQKQERAAAEKEAEGVVTKEHAPQKNVIIILCAILAVAVIGLGIVIVKKSTQDKK